MFLTGNIRNWELLGTWMALRARLKLGFRVVVLPLEADCLDEIAQSNWVVTANLDMARKGPGEWYITDM